MALVTTDKRKASRFDWTMLVIVILLIVVGLVNLYSALSFWGRQGGHSLFWMQIVWVVIGIALMLFMSFFDYHQLEKASLSLYIVSIVLLLAVFVFGKNISGHRGWLSIGGISLQPTEFAKVGLIIILARYFGDRPNPEGASLFDMWRPIVYSAIPAGLVALQGDLGSAIFFVLIFATFAWFGRLKGRGIVILALVAFAGATLLYFFGLSSYQKARITTFLDPSLDTRGSGYHLIQSKIAVGSGQLFGRGYLNGNINKLEYLPERHTDFVFPVLAEEWGFAGSAFALFLYFLFFTTGLEVAKRARDRFGLFLVLGIVAFIFWHVVINLGGVLGLMPMTGVPLPFLSYGGSFTIASMACIGVLMSVAMRRFLF